MGVPLIARDRVVGVLAILHREADHFTPEYAELALAFATQAAVAIENARLYEAGPAAGRAGGAAAARARPARRGHPDPLLGQPDRRGAAADLGAQPAAGRRAAGRAAAADPRRAGRDAHPAGRAAAERAGRGGAAASCCASSARRSPGGRACRSTSRSRGEGELPSEVQVALYRVAQEALNNIAKHAGRLARVDLPLVSSRRRRAVGPRRRARVRPGRGHGRAPGSSDHARARRGGRRRARGSEPARAAARASRWSGRRSRKRRRHERARSDQGDDRRRPRGGAERSERLPDELRRLRAGRPGVERARRARPVRAPPAGRGPDGPGDAGDGRRGRDAGGARALPGRAGDRADLVQGGRAGQGRAAGRRDRLPAQERLGRRAGHRDPGRPGRAADALARGDPGADPHGHASRGRPATT